MSGQQQGGWQPSRSWLSPCTASPTSPHFPLASAGSEAPTPAPPAPSSSIGTRPLVQAPAPAGYPALPETKMPGSEVLLSLPPKSSAGACPSSPQTGTAASQWNPRQSPWQHLSCSPQLARYLEAEHGAGPATAQRGGMSTHHTWLPDSETMGAPLCPLPGSCRQKRPAVQEAGGGAGEPRPPPAPTSVNVSRGPPCDPESRNGTWIWVSSPCQRAGGASKPLPTPCTPSTALDLAPVEHTKASDSVYAELKMNG